ncbi:MAG: sulfatase [Planctomycetota bacterium]|jgi:arylsulfatase A-like enzyme
MKAIMLMYDSLNRHRLSPYGCDWIHTPNFDRLAERSVRFTTAFAGSMPCMPARREIHTGRYNFLHRGWGPLEPFDDSMPRMLSENGIYTHLISDHYHYWEEGGATYHTKYDSWEIARGHEGDPWKAYLKDFKIPEVLGRKPDKLSKQDWVNRKYIQDEKDHPQTRTFSKGMEFLRTNHDADNWFLTIETFDPHEPYFSYDKYKKLYKHKYDGPGFDWPAYEPVTETPEQVRHCQYENAALVSMCDKNLGFLLDEMDRLNLWEDTMLIVNTDHGFMLGEHDWWGKGRTPFYNEVIQTPLFIWDPRSSIAGQTRDSLVQTIDLPATILDYFGLDLPADMQGKPLKDVITSDKPVRQAALFGIFGAHVNCTDGRYVYMRAPAERENQPLFHYTLMPSHMREAFSIHQLRTIQLQEPFAMTKGCKTMKIKETEAMIKPKTLETLLFDLEKDPKQENPIEDEAIEQKMIELMVKLMQENDAPADQYERLGFTDYVKSA